MFDDDSLWDPDAGLIADHTFFSTNATLDNSEFAQALSTGPWRWWVRAYDEAGNHGAWSDAKSVEIVEPTITKVAWRKLSGDTIASNTRIKVGDEVRIYVEADYAQIGDRFTVWVYEDDGTSFDDLITPSGVEVVIGDSNGTKGTGYVRWQVPWNPDNHFTSDLGIGDIYPEYRIWDTQSGWTLWPASTHKSDLIEAHGGELPPNTWTVIIHGLTTSTFNSLATGGGWVQQMAQAMRDESINLDPNLSQKYGLSNVVIHTVKADSGEIYNAALTAPEALATITDSAKHHVLLFDWSEVSNYDTQTRFLADPSDAFGLKRIITDPPPSGAQGDDGYAEASADVLYALLKTALSDFFLTLCTEL